MSGAVSVVIRTLNEADMIGETLNAVSSQQDEPDELIVVDCHSTDGTPTIARNRGATVVEMDPDGFTYGRGINFGFEQASGDYLVLLSGHAVPTTDRWLGELVESVSTDGVAGAYGKQVPLPDSNPLEARSLRATYGDRPGPRPPFSNANSIIEREVWRSFPFDEDLPYSEDRQWARTVQEAGYTIRYVPEAAVAHVHEESLEQVFSRNLNQGRAATRLDPSTSLSLPRALLRAGHQTVLDWRHLSRHRPHLAQFLRAPAYRTAEALGFYVGVAQGAE